MFQVGIVLLLLCHYLVVNEENEIQEYLGIRMEINLESSMQIVMVEPLKIFQLHKK